jgi:hypothetical protein
VRVATAVYGWLGGVVGVGVVFERSSQVVGPDVEMGEAKERLHGRGGSWVK